MLPESLVGPPGLHPKRVRLPREEDLSGGYGRVYLPHASERKYPPAPAGWVWRRIFPAGKLSTGPRSGEVRRRHAPEDMLRAAVKKGAKAAGIQKRVSWHTFRHSFAAHLLEAGYDIRTVRGLLGHTSVETTRIYTHALNKGVRGVRSPLGGG